MPEITKRELLNQALRWLHLSQGRPDDCKAYWDNPTPERAIKICREYLQSPEGDGVLYWLKKDVRETISGKMD